MMSVLRGFVNTSCNKKYSLKFNNKVTGCLSVLKNLANCGIGMVLL